MDNLNRYRRHFVFGLFGVFFVGLVSIYPTAAFGQKWKQTSFGIDYYRWIPEAVLSKPIRVDQNPNGIEIETRNLGSFGLGMGFRMDFPGMFGAQFGIGIANKDWRVNVDWADSSFSASSQVRWMNFHLPAHARIKLKVNDNFDLVGLFGPTFVLLPSDFEIIHDDFAMRSFRSTWIKVALDFKLGATYWFKQGGALELSVGSHVPLDRLAVGYFTFQQYPDETALNDFNGALGGVRLSYYFHENPERIYKKKKK